MTSVLGWLKPRLQCTYETGVPKKKLKLRLVIKGSKRQDNSKNNVAAVYFESSLMMHNPLFFVHKSGLSLRAGGPGFSWLLEA